MQVQAFALTPANKFSAKKRREQSKREENRQPCTPLRKSRNKVNSGGQLGGRAEEVDGGDPDSPFKVNPISLRTILSEQPDDTGDSNRLTVAAPGRPGIRYGSQDLCSAHLLCWFTLSCAGPPSHCLAISHPDIPCTQDIRYG